ncbi:YrhB domain-containing protein [Streptomyces sp. cg2]|uniref:YrhB domain-containing protein n=1 Tax=Streptomyces sp. cg2 TaxID=3238799 RepID=UPI0034E25A8B
MKAAEELLTQETSPYDPPLKLDTELVMEKDGILVVPYNSERYLETRDPRHMLLDCWPILVDLATGDKRHGHGRRLRHDTGLSRLRNHLTS